jgi:hypothetical protein
VRAVLPALAQRHSSMRYPCSHRSSAIRQCHPLDSTGLFLVRPRSSRFVLGRACRCRVAAEAGTGHRLAAAHFNPVCLCSQLADDRHQCKSTRNVRDCKMSPFWFCARFQSQRGLRVYDCHLLGSSPFCSRLGLSAAVPHVFLVFHFRSCARVRSCKAEGHAQNLQTAQTPSKAECEAQWSEA